MSNPQLAATAGLPPEDDIPRTFRREREAREREAREKESQARAPATPPTQKKAVPSLAVPEPQDGSFSEARSEAAVSAVVKAFDVPFLKLAAFLIKVVLAGIPALLLLTLIMWVFGQGLTTFFPQLVKMKILVTFPG